MSRAPGSFSFCKPVGRIRATAKQCQIKWVARNHAGASCGHRLSGSAGRLHLCFLPNRLLPEGATRDLAALQQGRARGKALLSAENYEVLGTLADGGIVAVELRWTATVGIKAGPFEAGQQLRARFAIFLEFRDGRIARQRNYDCFDPW